MPYATSADVQALAPNLNQGGGFSATTRPTADQVTAMIADTERLIDATLRHLGYDVDALKVDATTEAFKLLRDVSAHGALARVLRARSFGVGESTTPGADEAQKFFDSWLKRLGDSRDPLELPNVTRTTEAVVKDQAETLGSFVQGLAGEFDATTPPVTIDQVF